MRELHTVYRIIETEILRCPTQFYVKDRGTYQPIIISFQKDDPKTWGESSIYLLTDTGEKIRPFYDKRYGGSVKIDSDDQKYEIGAIDTYYIKFLMFHVLCDQMFGSSIPTSDSKIYKGTQIFALGSDVSGIMNTLFDRRARNRLSDLNCECYLTDIESGDSTVSNGIFIKTEHDELRIRADNDNEYCLVIDDATFGIFGRTGEYKNYRTLPIKITNPIGRFLIGCMVLTNLRCRCYDEEIRIRIQKLTDFARVIVDDPDRFNEILNFESFYCEIQEIAEILKD
jgi:hypothetical protein